MNTSTIAAYYKEHDPMKRKKLLDKSIELGEDIEKNTIRKEIWEIRYSKESEVDKKVKADGFLSLWMLMEYNKEVVGKFFGGKKAKKELETEVNRIGIQEFCNRSELHKELMYQECVHLVKTYIELCMTDRSYNTTFCGLISIGEDQRKQKIKVDLYKTAVILPKEINMQKEFSMITKAAGEVYEMMFPEEGTLID